jgi:large subunit ribosomal protein L3
MVKGIIGKKIGMTRFFAEDGSAVPVTVIQAGPCTVVQKKTMEKDKYQAVQLGFGAKKKLNKPAAGHARASGKTPEVLREFPVDDPADYEVGAEVVVEDLFNVGEKINITGSTKGRGFAGVMKRHGFSGGRATHGCTIHRATGSIGAAADPSRVFPARKMPGRMGGATQTVRNLEVVDIRAEHGLMLVKGAVPGPKNGLIVLRKK